MDVFARLQQLLDIHPAGAPASDNFTHILQILFTPEEAEAACLLTFIPQPLSLLAAKGNTEKDLLHELYENMVSKAVIISRQREGQEIAYALLPTIPGLFEFPFMLKQPYFDVRELGQLWHDYHTEALGMAFGSSATPHTRVVPVQSAIPLTTEILPYQDVFHLIDNASYIALAPCACRTSVGACSKPKEVCFVFGSTGKFLVEQGAARTIDKIEAKKVLKLAEDEGLVHCTNNSQKDRTVICNCCGCCCTLLRGINLLHNPRAIASSAYTISYDIDKCTLCEACLDNRCQVYAISGGDRQITIETERCIGCGLCISVCPTNALRLVLRTEVPHVPEDGRELMGTLLQQKGKLEAFTKLHQIAK